MTDVMKYQLNLTRDERALYSHLVPDYEVDSVKPMFQIKKEFDLTDTDLDLLLAFLQDAKETGCNDVWFAVDRDTGQEYLTVTGESPLDVDELELYGEIMIKVRAFRKMQLESAVEQHERVLEKLKNDLETFVW